MTFMTFWDTVRMWFYTWDFRNNIKSATTGWHFEKCWCPWDSNETALCSIKFSGFVTNCNSFASSIFVTNKYQIFQMVAHNASWMGINFLPSKMKLNLIEVVSRHFIVATILVTARFWWHLALVACDTLLSLLTIFDLIESDIKMQI